MYKLLLYNQDSFMNLHRIIIIDDRLMVMIILIKRLSRAPNAAGPEAVLTALTRFPVGSAAVTLDRYSADIALTEIGNFSRPCRLALPLKSDTDFLFSSTTETVKRVACFCCSDRTALSFVFRKKQTNKKQRSNQAGSWC